jgi:hypothetical protein
MSPCHQGRIQMSIYLTWEEERLSKHSITKENANVFGSVVLKNGSTFQSTMHGKSKTEEQTGNEKLSAV